MPRFRSFFPSLAKRSYPPAASATSGANRPVADGHGFDPMMHSDGGSSVSLEGHEHQ